MQINCRVNSCFLPRILLKINRIWLTRLITIISSNMAFNLEQYRKGTSFGNWVNQLHYFFSVKNVAEDKMAYLNAFSGPTVFEKITHLHLAGNFDEIHF